MNANVFNFKTILGLDLVLVLQADLSYQIAKPLSLVFQRTRENDSCGFLILSGFNAA